MEMSITTTNISGQKKLRPDVKDNQHFNITADEGTLNLDIVPAYHATSTSFDIVRVWIDGRLVRTTNFVEENKAITVSKVLDKGYHDYDILFQSRDASHYITYSASLELVSVGKPSPPIKQVSVCPFFAFVVITLMMLFIYLISSIGPTL